MISSLERREQREEELSRLLKREQILLQEVDALRRWVVRGYALAVAMFRLLDADCGVSVDAGYWPAMKPLLDEARREFGEDHNHATG